MTDNNILKVGDVVKAVDFPKGIYQIYEISGGFVYIMPLSGIDRGKRFSGGWFDWRFEKLPEKEALMWLI